MSGHTAGFCPQTQKLEAPYKGSIDSFLRSEIKRQLNSKTCLLEGALVGVMHSFPGHLSSSPKSLTLRELLLAWCCKNLLIVGSGSASNSTSFHVFLCSSLV